MSNMSYLEPARATPLTGVDQAISTQCVFMGIMATDEGSGSIKIHVYHGTSDTGAPIAAIEANAGGHQTTWFGPNGIACPDGVFIKVYTGGPEGNVFTR
jgi:hypothetical protein